MIVIQDTTVNLTSTIAAFDFFGAAALAGAGRESGTETFDVVHTDSIHGDYIAHPEAFRGRWPDECIDGLIDLIPGTATVDFNFTKTIEEGLI